MSRSRTRVLFIALSASTHTHSWVSLLDVQSFDARLFGLPLERNMHAGISTLFPIPGWRRLGARIGRRLFGTQFFDDYQLSELGKVVKRWRPDVVHTLGLDPASYFLLEARSRIPLLATVPWIVTARGGPELSLSRLLVEDAKRIRAVLGQCDEFIADNALNYGYAQQLGLDPSKISPLGVTPGTGGVDVEELEAMRQIHASASRRIVYPKAYECPASKALPVFEALRLAWDKIQPCEIHLTALIPETRMWLAAMPKPIQEACRLYDRIPRQDLLRLMAEARVVLAPSLTDGIPNTLYEAMALGAVPIVSPIDTLRDVFHDDVHVMYARNLYPEEIARALAKAMNDDLLVDTIVDTNLRMVRQLADRKEIARRVRGNYARFARSRADGNG